MEINERLARLETLSETQHNAVLEKFDAGYNMLLEKLKPIEEIKSDITHLEGRVDKRFLELEERVDNHDHRISFVRGILAVLSFAWTGLVAWLGFRHG